MYSSGDELIVIQGFAVFAFIFVIMLAYTVAKLIAWGKIGRKCGYSPGWTVVLMVLPLVSEVFFFVMAFKKEPWSWFADKNKEVEAMKKRLEDLEAKVGEKRSACDKCGRTECECPPIADETKK